MAFETLFCLDTGRFIGRLLFWNRTFCSKLMSLTRLLYLHVVLDSKNVLWPQLINVEHHET